jgi:hypothetical protein
VVIGIVETGEARVYASINTALAEWGLYPTDIASEVVIFYDNDGTWLKPVERYMRKWYHLRPQLVSVELRRAEPDDTYQDKLGYMLRHEVVKLAPNSFVTSLEQLRQMHPWDERS